MSEKEDNNENKVAELTGSNTAEALPEVDHSNVKIG